LPVRLLRSSKLPLRLLRLAKLTRFGGLLSRIKSWIRCLLRVLTAFNIIQEDSP
jgi:hypothetical protein